MSSTGMGWRSGQASDVTGAASTATVSSINPTTAPRKGPPILLTVTGTGFVAGTVVYAGYNPQGTTFVNATTLQVQKFNPCPDHGNPGTLAIGARKPGEVISGTQNFTAT